MLLAIRERIMGFLGWVILSLIFVAFAFWGLESYLQTSTPNYAARVNDIEISLRQHDMAYQALAERVRESLGNDFDKSGFTEELLRDRALQQLITDELLIQAAEASGFAVGDQMIAAQINAVDAFKQDGQFSKEQYERVLGYQGMSPGQFEWTLKRDLMADQLQNGIALTSMTTDAGFSRVFTLEGQQRRFDYAVLPASLVENDVSVSEEEISAYYADHGDEFMSREQARVDYVELNAAELELQSELDEARIQALYEEQAGQYVTPEERRARHILIATPDTSQEGIVAAVIKATEVSERLEKGEDFAALAAELSDDTATAENGGDLGFFAPGVMTSKFDDAVFALEVGEVSDSIQTDFGFHIIELLEIKPEERIPLDDVRDELVRELQSDERADLFYDKSDIMANVAFEQPDSLEGVAEALQLDVMKSDWIGRDGGPGIGGHDDVVESVYGIDVLENGNNSTVIEIGENHVVVLRIDEYREAKQRPLDEVREQVSSTIRAKKIREMLEAKGSEYIEALRTGSQTLESIAGAHDLQVTVNPLLNRRAKDHEAAIVTEAFSMLPPGDSEKVYGGFTTPRGGFALIVLHEVRMGTVDDLTGEQQQLARRGMDRILGAVDVRMVLDAIKARGSVHVPDDNDQ